MASTSLRKRQVNFPTEVEVDAKNPPSNMDESPSTLSANKDRTGTRNFYLLWNRFLQAYSTFAGNSLNQDKILKTIQYSLWMLSRFYVRKDNTVARKALVTISGELNWARYVTRLLGLPTALEGVQSGSWAAQKSLGRAMAWAMVFYYPLENLAYLKWKAPEWIGTPKFASSLTKGESQTGPSRLAARATAWSCRFWVAYMVLDIVRSTLALRPTIIASPEQQEGPSTELVVEVSNDTKRNERLQILRNVLFLAPTIHWSLPNWDTQPWLSETVCNSLLWLEAVVCMYQGIKNIPAPKSV